MKMRAGYKVETNFFSKLESVSAIIVFNYVFYKRPCKVISHVINYMPNKASHSNALGIWKVKLKTKKK